MKISIDFDGTITKHPDFFLVLMRALQSDGHEVGILTGHHHDKEQEDLIWLKARGFPVPDFWIGRSPTTDSRTGEFKKRAIAKNNIDYHIDDCDRGHPDSVAAFADIEKVICIR